MSQEQKQFTFHLYVFSGHALFYLAISRNRGHKGWLILNQVFVPSLKTEIHEFPFLVRVCQLRLHLLQYADISSIVRQYAAKF